VAAAPTHEELFQKLEAMGADYERVICDFVYDPDKIYIGGFA